MAVQIRSGRYFSRLARAGEGAGEPWRVFAAFLEAAPDTGRQPGL